MSLRLDNRPLNGRNGVEAERDCPKAGCCACYMRIVMQPGVCFEGETNAFFTGSSSLVFLVKKKGCSKGRKPTFLVVVHARSRKKKNRVAKHNFWAKRFFFAPTGLCLGSRKPFGKCLFHFVPKSRKIETNSNTVSFKTLKTDIFPQV